MPCGCRKNINNATSNVVRTPRNVQTFGNVPRQTSLIRNIESSNSVVKDFHDKIEELRKRFKK